MNASNVIVLLLVLVVNCSSPVNAVQLQAGDDKQSPNIIFLLADDLGLGDVNYNGGKAETPWLNRMSKSDHSVVLSHHYSGAPVCSPSRATILTGRNHNRYCMWASNTAKGANEVDFVQPQMMPLPIKEETVAEVLKRAGYRTAMFGKWHLGSFKDIHYKNKMWPKVDPGMHGFDEWYATERSVPTANSNQGCFRMHNSRSRCTNYYSRDNGSSLVAHPHRIYGDDSKFIADLTNDFINRQTNKKQPFFVYAAFHAVHKPTIAVGSYKKYYINLNYSHSEANFYGTITAMDAAIGEIRQKLYDLGIANNTMIWFTSDNGPAQGLGSTNGLLGHKGTLSEGGIRVPGIIEWPAAIKQNRRESYPVVTTDFLPTVVDITKIKLQSNNTLDGESILPLLMKSVKKRKSPINWMFRYQPDKKKIYQQVTLQNQYKLVQDIVKDEVVDSKLYDLTKDGGELRDVKSRHLAVLQDMQEVSKRWKHSVVKDIENGSCDMSNGEIDEGNKYYRTNFVSPRSYQ